MKKKPGPKPKGFRPLTAVEKTQRSRMRLKIIREELNSVGLAPNVVYLPKSYIKGIQEFENMFGGSNDSLEDFTLQSSWIAKAIYDFLKQNAETFPHTEFAKIVNSDDFIESSNLDYGIATLMARGRIREYEIQHEENLK